MSYNEITCDSRLVTPGCTYVAIQGANFNGEDFIEQAVEAGAGKIVTSLGYDKDKIPKGTLVLRVEDTRRYLALKSAEIYGPQPEKVVSITGTNGKTSVASMYRQITAELGEKSASIGTLGVETNVDVDLEDYEILTSPDPVTLHKTLSKLSESGITHAAIEASSHGLSQRRTDGVKSLASAFTNLSPEHLDFHKDMQHYLESKMRLFSELTEETAVLNADIPEYPALLNAAKKANLNIITYGLAGDNIKFISRKDDQLKLEVNGQDYNFDFHPVGDFQNYNIMAAIGLALATYFTMDEIAPIIGKVISAPGRLEMVGKYNGARIFVDYAHTPDALDKALSSLRKDCGGKLHSVFGAGGDRDTSKRKLMGEVSARLADHSYITDDNPRTEDPTAIREEIFAACPNADNIGDRANAIEVAMGNLQENDMLLIAGKGHEDYQIIGTEKIHFSDREEVQKIIAAKGS